MLAKRGWLLLLAATAVVYFYGLGRAPFVGADEPRYAQVAREMFERGDAVTPTLNNHTWFEKPALGYWTAMAGFKLFGVTEWAARLGAACAGWLTIFLVGWTAKRVEENEGRGGENDDKEVRAWLQLSSGAVAATSAGLIVFSRALNFDIMITVAVTCALASFFAAELEIDTRKKRWLLVGFYAGMGAALLAKGLIGVVIPCGVVVVYHLLCRRRPEQWKTAVWGFLLTVAVAALWYAPVIARHGWVFIDEFFVKHHFARYLSNKYHHPQPFWFYFAIIPALMLPWSAFLAAGVSHTRSWNWRVEDEAVGKLRLFALAWVLFPLLFFSVSGSKLPGYILPALPGAALLAGERLAAYLRGELGTGWMRATGALMFALSVAGLVFGLKEDSLSGLSLALVTAPAIVASVSVMLLARRRGWSVFLVVAATFLTTLLIALCVLEKVSARESVRGLLLAAEARGYGASPVLTLHHIERTAEFYAAGRLFYEEAGGGPLKFEGAGEVWEEARRRGGTLLVFVPEEYAGQLTNFQYLESEVIGSNGPVTLVAVRAR